MSAPKQPTPPTEEPKPPASAGEGATRSNLQLIRIPVDKPQAAVAFLHGRSQGVMDLIAHFWERLAHTPPLQRRDLHLVVATREEMTREYINISLLNKESLSGALLYVPKAHRADVLALDQPTAAAFASYIAQEGPRATREDATIPVEIAASGNPGAGTIPTGIEIHEKDRVTTAEMTPMIQLFDLTANGGNAPPVELLHAEPPAYLKNAPGRVPIDFLTGDAAGIGWMTPLLLPTVHKRAPQRQLVNVVMQLPSNVPADADPHVRLARDVDVPTLNRWRRQYKEERGILFDADMDEWIQNKRVFVYDLPEANAGNGGGTAMATATIVAVAKIDLELHQLMEIGGVYTFPEHRNKGYGASIVRDLAYRIRQGGKTPTLQVDEQNIPALHLYEKAGWRAMGKLARVWLTG